MSGVDESSKDTGPMLPGFETCETATERWPTPSARDWRSGRHSEATAAENARPLNEVAWRQSISSAAASPASPSPTPADALGNPIAAGFGPSSIESFAALVPGGFWLKTLQGCVQSKMPLDGMGGSLEVFSETWPKRGTMRSGSTYPLRTLERPTSESESSLWPTPQTWDAVPMKLEETIEHWEEQAEKHAARGVNKQHPLTIAVKRWPTPVSGMAERGDRGDLNTRVKGYESPSGHTKMWPTPSARLGDQRGPQAKRYHNPERSNDLDDAVAARGATGQLNPTFVCWLMGFPKGWTELEG